MLQRIEDANSNLCLQHRGSDLKNINMLIQGKPLKKAGSVIFKKELHDDLKLHKVCCKFGCKIDKIFSTLRPF